MVVPAGGNRRGTSTTARYTLEGNFKRYEALYKIMSAGLDGDSKVCEASLFGGRSLQKLRALTIVPKDNCPSNRTCASTYWSRVTYPHGASAHRRIGTSSFRHSSQEIFTAMVNMSMSSASARTYLYIAPLAGLHCSDPVV